MEEQKIVTILSAGADAKGIIRPVTIEVEVTNGIGIHLVGLADAQVKESLLRVVTALQALDFRIPGKKIIINITSASESSTPLTTSAQFGCSLLIFFKSMFQLFFKLQM